MITGTTQFRSSSVNVKKNCRVFFLFFFQLYRHGDRSPVKAYPQDPYQESAWPQGFGQLSQVGIPERKFLFPNRMQGKMYFCNTFSIGCQFGIHVFFFPLWLLDIFAAAFLCFLLSQKEVDSRLFGEDSFICFRKDFCLHFLNQQYSSGNGWPSFPLCAVLAR